MSLSNAIQIGKSALAASQVGINVAGNNIANAATPGYTRQTTRLAPVGADGYGPGLALGRGVGVREIRREIDTALQSRLWSGVSTEAGSLKLRELSAGVESLLGELGDGDLSSELASFFNAWSEVANGAQGSSMVVRQGERLAATLRRTSAELGTMRTQLDRQLSQTVEQANEYLTRIAAITAEISAAEAGHTGGSAGNLRDQRDQAVTELSALVDVSAVEHEDGSFELLIGSSPVLQGGDSRGLTLTRDDEDGDGLTDLTLAIDEDGQRLTGVSGAIGSLIDGRDTRFGAASDALDEIAASLAYEVNRLHSTGANRTNPRIYSAGVAFAPDDRTIALSDPDNESMSGLPISPVNGGFVVRVTNRSTGAASTTYVPVDMDGFDSTGASGYSDDTTLEDIRAAIDASPHVAATITSDGKLTIAGDNGYDVTFGDDTSGVLAAIGINSFFTGTSAANIEIRSDLLRDPAALMTGKIVNGSLSENSTSLAIAGLSTATADSLNGRSISEAWTDSVQGIASRAASDTATAASATIVRESLESQRASLSGVSTDEEALDLLAFQRQYQGAARLISIADELTQTLLNLV